ncbi:hypothetical protein K0T92_18450 [Paenibacillus oenotherae]|uniref:Uncharacterized protein n=1 Tax=Paenibacillus oenotherae TaxID=1435645 RepID=A0ABS7D9T0_9BACL|nr:hypothetical protein [Paenibacillus oenotherae]MBW7476702.1 hypothetical protein [Paenibacillus oenotherae]
MELHHKRNAKHRAFPVFFHLDYYRTEEIKRLLSESLREEQDSYAIQELFEHFPTTTELLEASEQQLIRIKGIG